MLQLLLVTFAVSLLLLPAVATSTKFSLTANETELLTIMSLQASASLPVISNELADTVRVGHHFRAVPGLFAQQLGVSPKGDAVQLPNFGALQPWSDILSLLTKERKEGKGHHSHRVLLVMIRHGEAWENLNPLPNSQCEFEYDDEIIQNFDSDLSDKGVQQAKDLNALLTSDAKAVSGDVNATTSTSMTWFEAMGLDNKPFLASPLTRTLQTASHVLSPGLPVPRVVATEVMRASIGTDVCNYRRSVLSSTALHTPPPPFDSSCTLPLDSLTEIYHTAASSSSSGDSPPLLFEFPIRPPGGDGFGLYSDAESLWRADVAEADQSQQTRAMAFIAQLFQYREFYTQPTAAGSGEEGEEGSALLLPVVGVVTHGEMVSAVYEALGEDAYSPKNTQVVPVMIEMA